MLIGQFLSKSFFRRLFEMKAIGLLEAVNNTNSDWAEKLVTTSTCYYWTNDSCMQIAAVANARVRTNVMKF